MHKVWMDLSKDFLNFAAIMAVKGGGTTFAGDRVHMERLVHLPTGYRLPDKI
jgi:hypothetical protein